MHLCQVSLESAVWARFPDLAVSHLVAAPKLNLGHRAGGRSLLPRGRPGGGPGMPQGTPHPHDRSSDLFKSLAQTRNHHASTASPGSHISPAVPIGGAPYATHRSTLDTGKETKPTTLCVNLKLSSHIESIKRIHHFGLFFLCHFNLANHDS